MKEDSLSLQTSRSLRELPPRAPALIWRKFVSLCLGGYSWGKFFVFGEVFLYGAAIAPVLCVGRIWRISFAWVLYPITLRPPIGRDSRTLQKIRTSHSSPKTSPQDPHHQKGETNLRSSHGGGLVGKFGEVEGGLEGEGTPSERGFLLPPRSSSPYLLQDSPRTKRSRRKRSAGRTKVIIRTEETVPMPSRSPTVEIAFCVERK